MLELLNDEYKKEALKLLFVKWLCESNNWLRKYMFVISKLIGKEFTTLDLPYKSSRSYELIKIWEKKGFIRITDYISKAKKYKFTTTLFAKAIEEKQVSDEIKQKMLEELDEII